MQILNALPLTLLPYSVTRHYDLVYGLEDVRNGKRYMASVARQSACAIAAAGPPAIDGVE